MKLFWMVVGLFVFFIVTSCGRVASPKRGDSVQQIEEVAFSAERVSGLAAFQPTNEERLRERRGEAKQLKEVTFPLEILRSFYQAEGKYRDNPKDEKARGRSVDTLAALYVTQNFRDMMRVEAPDRRGPNRVTTSRTTIVIDVPRAGNAYRTFWVELTVQDGNVTGANVYVWRSP